MSGFESMFWVMLTAVLTWGVCGILAAGSSQSESQCVGTPLNKLTVNEGLTAGTVLLKFKQDQNIVYSFHQDLYSQPALNIFQISPAGIVTNIVTLDHEDERGSEFTLTVLANNIGKSSQDSAFVTACSLSIIVVDINDNSPQFKKDLYVGFVTETSTSTVVQGLHGIYATDLDSGTNSVDSYEILPGNGADKFEAVTETLSGVKFLNIRSKGKLDREEASFYVLTVQATDGGTPTRSARTQVRINIEDRNDCAPKFTSSEYIVTVLSTTPVSTAILTVHAQDEDYGKNADIYYYFKRFQKKSQNDNCFTLDPHTGVIRVARKLDFTGSLIHMTVVAQDRGTPAKRSETVVKIRLYQGRSHVYDHDQPIVFAKNSYLARIREDLPINSHVLYPDVLNLRRSRNEPKFKILSHLEVPFEVDTNSGFLYLTENLDYERKSVYEFSLALTSSQESVANVTVLVDDADENVHPPAFHRLNDEAEFSRVGNREMSRLVKEVKAFDPDDRSNARLSYFIDDGDGIGRFTIEESTGRVLSVPRLNWNEVDHLGLVIEARDSASRWRSGKQFLFITVVGEQDCNPMFEKSVYDGNIRENLPRGTFVTVTRAQMCRGQGVEYWITAGNSRNNFKIDKESGIVTTTKPLDREEEPEYTLEITARNGSRSSKTLLVINIDDVNDHSPLFSRKRFQVGITENRGEISSLLCLVATDKDYGNNARVKYNIVSGNRKNLFDIDVALGNLSCKSLNFEDTRVHTLRIKATDQGVPPRSSFTTVQVLVKNVNDPPKFESDESTVEILEENPAGTRVAFLSVVDEDEGRNGEFECSYENVDPKEFGKFRIETFSNGCEVKSKVLLKWFEGNSYSLRVRVNDKASLLIRKSDFIIVKIKVKDVNNHDPMFLQDSYWSSVSPGTTSILTVTATDEDGGRNARIRYSLAVPSQLFRIDSRIGQLTAVKGKLHVGKHKVDVYAEDQGSPKRRTKVTCFITVDRNINRSPLRITLLRYKYTLNENVDVNTIVTIVTVNKRNVNYTIVGGNTEKTFSISQDGKITVIKTLDYEKIKLYKLVVRITYRRRGGMELAKETTITIQILNVNDNEPVFTTLSNPLVVTINTPVHPNSIITKISAYDADLVNSVTYRIKLSSSQVPFDLNSISGEITAQRSLESRSWTFTIVAEDSVEPKRHSELDVHVRIRRGRPRLKIPQHQLSASVNEGPLGVGRDITSFSVNNEGEHDLTYSISGGNYENAFCVDVRGFLHVVKELDRELREHYILSVSVNDGHNSEVSDVNITVNDINDHRPQFSSEVISIFIDENTYAQKIWTFSAKDWDVGNITYEIVGTSKQSSSNIFAMDQGILMITRTLDYEKTRRHVITIAARDQGSLETFTRAVVHVRDKNDNFPSFLSRRYAERVPLNAPRGYIILQTLATDQDSGHNGQISYAIHPVSNMFTIDESTGWIRVASELTHGSFLFNVTAKDHGTPSYSDTASVTIVVEVNAGPPRFLYAGFTRGFHASVRENEPRGTKVLTLTAVSRDLVTYELYQNDVTDFIIDPISGDITTTKSLDYEHIKYYEFTVSATDRSGRSSLAHVGVSVINVNDNKPKILNKNEDNLISCRIRHDAAVGSFLMNIQAQDLDNDPLRFHLAENSKSESKFFRIDTTGRITTARSLVGRRQKIDIAVTVRDNGRPVLTDTVTVIVVVVKYGNNLETHFAEVSEDTIVGKTISVSKKLQPTYKDPSYSIIYPPQSPIAIHSTLGSLSLVRKLDYEECREYSLTVRLNETRGNNNYFDVDIKVEVKDANDNRPEFLAPGNFTGCENPVRVKIHKNAQRGSLVYQFKARDRDSGRNGKVVYSIERCSDCTDLFTMDQDNPGALKTTGVFLTRPQYQVDVVVSDEGSPQMKTRGCILVQAEHLKPLFTKQEYYFEIDESADIGHQVGVVKAEGFGVSVTYELRHPSLILSVNPTTGELTLISTLNYENSNERRIEVDVDTKNQASAARVIILVRDVNDCAPKFDESTYIDYVPESAPVGSTVLKLHASDDDSGLNSDVRYSLNSEDFVIDSYTGVVTTAVLLDFEIKRSYVITARAHDRGSPSQVGETRLGINIVNVNDNRPIFTSQEYSCSIWENAEHGSELTTVKATDADGDKVFYDITSGDSAGLFVLDPDTGVLHLTNDKSLSLVGPYYTLNISATDEVHWEYSRIKVNIKDINNHAPVFKDCNDYKPSIRENDPPRTFVLQVDASDEDLGTNGEVEYAIVQQQDGANFAIDRRTGRIESSSRFDRERQRKFPLLIKATDGSRMMRPEERLEGSCSVEIEITDVNDNKPIFDRIFYTQSVNENVEIGHRIIQVRARDDDEGLNAKISFSFKKSSSLFVIDSETGDIRTQAKLVDKKKSYKLKAIAKDHGNPFLFSEVDVTINVIESNDEPQYLQSFYEVTIPENFTGFIANVTATSRNSEHDVFYSFVVDNNHRNFQRRTFSIDTNGVVKVKSPLDRETIPVYTLTIRAQTTLELSSFATLKIVITDVNDCSPEFLSSRYFGEVSENVKAGTSVLTVSASDPDLRSNTEYSMVFRNAHFSIHPRTGIIFTKRRFDREQKENYLFQVKAIDRDNLRLSSRVSVYVKIKDLNDNPPVFQHNSYATSVKENEVNESVIDTVVAHDRDRGINARITYTIKGGNFDGNFRIDPEDGRVFVNGKIDYELRQKYELYIGAWDGKNNATTRMIITVKNENDNNPTFGKKIHKASIKERSPKGSLVTSLEASDPDALLIEYELSVQIRNVFEIHPTTGDIRTKIELDRELKDSYKFEAYARDDDGRTGTVSVIISVLDVNDNAPIFLEKRQRMSVIENAPPWTVVGRIKATDIDDVNSGNGRVSYGIIMDPINAFSVEPNTGILRTTAELDRENTSTVTLIVNASDNGIPSQYTRGEVIVTVLDANDHSPKFSQKIFEETIAEDAKVGLTILQLVASDKDIGLNANLSFAMLRQRFKDKFYVDSNSGIVKLIGQLDYERATEHRFVVLVEDGGIPKRSDNATVIVKVTDSNDCPPVFSQTYNFVLPEGVYNNQTLSSKLVATDADRTPQNAKLEYSIPEDAGESGLVVNRNTGELFLNTALDYESRKAHTFKVRATNLASPPLYGESEVKIEVTDINDNPPEIVESSRDQKILENSTTEGHVTRIGTLLAFDRDRKPNGPPFTFGILAGNEKNLFQLDSKTGSLSTVANFDREEQALYILKVWVRDNGTPALTNNITVRVHVTDRNDNQHKEGHLELTLNLFDHQTISPNAPIGQVFVNDTDINDLRYYDVLTGDTSTFIIERLTGNIKTKKQPSAKEYKFLVRVSDRNSSFHPVECKVTIKINRIPSIAFTKSITLRFLEMTVGEFVTNLDVYKKEIAKALRVSTKNVDILSIQDSGDGAVDVRMAAHGSPYFAPESMISIIKRKRSLLKYFQNVIVGYDACSEEPEEPGGCRSIAKLTIKVQTVNNGRGKSFTFVKTLVDVRFNSCENLYPEKRSCKERPCFNSGVCQDVPGGYLCICPTKYQGPNCELTTRSFKPGDWVSLRPLRTCSIGTISLEFSTLRENGLLLYAGPSSSLGPGDTSDFLAIQLHRGKVRVKLSLGDFYPSVIHVAKSKKLNDGDWHMVEIYRNGSSIRVVIDQCNSSLVRSSESGQKEDRRNCEQKIDIRNTKFHSLNINTPIQLGGLLGSPPDSINVRPTTYDGCIRNVKENGIMIDLKDTSNSMGSQEGCPVIDQHCSSPSPCARNASCIPSRKSFSCICSPGTGGLKCKNASVEQTFEDSSFIAYQPQSSFLKNYNSKFTDIQMMVRTRDENGGPLLTVRKKIGFELLSLRLTKSDKDGLSLEARVKLRREMIIVRLTNTMLDDGQWHHMSIRRNRNEVHLGIDLENNPKTAKVKGSDSFLQIELNQDTEIILGNSAGSGNGFVGCVKDFRFNGKALHHNKSDHLVKVKEYNNMQHGCLSGACDEQDKCPGKSFCYDKWRLHECLPRRCVNQGPCLNGAQCVDYGVDGVAMYKCKCRAGFNGSICQFGSKIIRLNADVEVINIKLLIGLPCFVLVLVLATLVIICYHRYQTNGKVTFGKARNISQSDKKDSGKKGLVVEWSDSQLNKTNNCIKNLPVSKQNIRAHVHNTNRLSPVPTKTHPLEMELNEPKPLSQLPAWDIPPMIDIILSPESESAPGNDECIEDSDENWQDAESKIVPRSSLSDLSETQSDDTKGQAVSWSDIEEYGKKFYKLTRKFLARDDGRPGSAVSTISDSSSVVTVVENPQT